MLQFELPKDRTSIIKVIGVGGGGSNAVNHMFRQGIKGVDFIVCNTDKQALDISPVPVKVQLGKTLTQGLGAGMLPEVGKNAAIESIDEIKALLKNTKMVFITAGMGKGTGTGAAPIIAQAAREMGILTVGIVTIPFSFEGAKKRQQAEAGIEELKKSVDTLLIICNERLREIHGNLTVVNAFVHADNVLSNAARSIAEIISNTLHVNVDFNDISTVMKDSGVAVLGTASASGDGRSINAVEMALNSPLLNDNEITGARYVLMNVTSGADEITMDELGEITDYIQNAAGQTAEIVTGYGVDPNLGDKVNVTIIATGFQSKSIAGVQSTKRPEKKVLKLDDNVNKTAEPTPVVEAKTKVEETIESLERVLKSELLAKEEPVIETFKEEVTLNDIVTDPLEPVLIVKEPVVENAIEIEDTNDSEETVIVDEPLLEVKVEEIVPVVEEPVVEMKRVEPVLVETGEAVAEVKVEEPIAEVKTEEPVAEVKVEETIADLSPVTDVKEEVKTGEPVAVVETVTEISNVIPVVEETKQEIVEEKVEIEFEIEKAPEKVVEFTLTEEVVENTVTEPVKEETLLPVNEVKTEAPVVNEVKEEISNMVVNEVKEEVKQEPVAEVKEEVKSEVEQKKEEVLEEPILIKNRTEVKEEKKSTELQ